MKRVLFWTNIAFLIGIYAGYYYPIMTTFMISAIALLVCIAKLLLSKENKLDLAPLAVCISLVIGALLIQFANNESKRPLTVYVNEYVTIHAVSVEKQTEKEVYTELIASVLSVTFLDKTVEVNEKIRLTFMDNSKIPKFGEEFTAKCKIVKPAEALNKGGFDYSLYLKTKGIFYSGYVERNSVEVIGQKSYSVLDYIYLIRLKLFDLISEILPNEEGGLLNGILLGDTSGMSAEMLEFFRISGLSHTVAVSGMHISYVIAIMFALLKIFKISKRKTMAMTSFVILFMTILTGATPSVVRACIMSLLLFAADALYRKQDTLTSLSISAVLILIVSPFSAFDLGFILSFSAAFGIIVFSDPISDWLHRILHLKGTEFFGKKTVCAVVVLFSTCISVQLVTIPIVSFYFQNFTIWALFSNLITEPIMSVVMAVGMLIFTVGLIVKPFALATGSFIFVFLKVVTLTSTFFGKLPFGGFLFGQVTPFFVLVYGMCLILIYHLLKRKKSIWIPISSLSIVMLLLVCLIFTYINQDIAQVSFINVGQGDCTLIKLSKDRDMLIDAGGSINSKSDVGKNTVLPYLLQNGVHDIEFMFATHPHEDHIEGLISIINTIKVDNLIIPFGFVGNTLSIQLLEAAKNRNVNVYVVGYGDAVKFADNIQLKVLMPDHDWLQFSDDENNNSLVLRFDYGQNSFLFMADMEAIGERYLINKMKSQLDIDVLKVGHHGSKTSTTEEFLEATTPNCAVISVGAKNSYGHPHKVTLDQLSQKNIKAFRTDENKDITFIMDYKTLKNILYTKKVGE